MSYTNDSSGSATNLSFSLNLNFFNFYVNDPVTDVFTNFNRLTPVAFKKVCFQFLLIKININLSRRFDVANILIKTG